eukprot:s1569_g3.t1
MQQRLAFTFFVCAAAKWPLRGQPKHVDAVPASFDCEMRKMAYEYGKKLIPRMGAFEPRHEKLLRRVNASKAALYLCQESLYYALDLDSADCHVAPKGKPFTGPETKLPTKAVFVAVDGRDDGDGTEAQPLKSLQVAADAAAQRGAALVLRAGTHFLDKTLHLSPLHSGLVMMAYPGERVEISGGQKLQVSWKPYNVSGANIWVTEAAGWEEMTALHINGARATRARYPNMPHGIESSCGYGCMIDGGKGKWTPPDFQKYGNVSFYTDKTSQHYRNTTHDWFNEYMIGVGGLCSVYDPPVSYWCSENPSGGGAFAFRTPSGLSFDFPNGPYKHAEDARLFAWRPNRWANWMFDVAKYDATTQNFTFGRGGNQGARGENTGGDFFIENVMEELDYPGEFFFDKHVEKLYLYYNGTGAPPANASYVVPRVQVLVNLTGTQWSLGLLNPVKDIKVQGIHFSASAPTYMMPHGVPSAGDWALDRYSAVFLQGTQGTLIDSCVFDRLEGNAVMVSGYNRDATIQNSDFSYLGGNAVAAWGYTNETRTDRGRPGIILANAPAAGVDGTDRDMSMSAVGRVPVKAPMEIGIARALLLAVAIAVLKTCAITCPKPREDGEHPLRTTVQNCTAREIGLYETLCCAILRVAKTAQSKVLSNVFFNGPRAGINMNDGFGGGDEIAFNLVFSTCRESGDHGPFNSWDRQPFLTAEDVDNDDGSCYYKTHDNFLVYGGQAMKNDFGGHDNHHYDNVDAYVDHALGVCETIAGHEDYFFGNYVVMTSDSVGTCLGNRMHDNRYFTPSGKLDAGCGGFGGTVNKTPSDDAILEEARKKLGMTRTGPHFRQAGKTTQDAEVISSREPLCLYGHDLAGQMRSEISGGYRPTASAEEALQRLQELERERRRLAADLVAQRTLRASLLALGDSIPNLGGVMQSATEPPHGLTLDASHLSLQSAPLLETVNWLLQAVHEQHTSLGKLSIEIESIQASAKSHGGPGAGLVAEITADYTKDVIEKVQSRAASDRRFEHA